MKVVYIGILLFCSVPGMSYGSKVAECHGSDIFGDPTIAEVFFDNGIGKIIITTTIDTVESSTKVDGLDSEILTVYDNDFRMYFKVSFGHPESPVEAFRDGAFFVEDFECMRSQNVHQTK